MLLSGEIPENYIANMASGDAKARRAGWKKTKTKTKTFIHAPSNFNTQHYITLQTDPRLFIHQLTTSCSPLSQPQTHLKSKGQHNQLVHTDLNDISAMTAPSYLFLTPLCLSAQPVILQAWLPLNLPLTAPQEGQAQIQPLNHIIPKSSWETVLCAHEKCGLLK